MSADHPVKNGTVSDQIKHKNASDWNDLGWGKDWKKCCLFHDHDRNRNNFLLLHSNLKNSSWQHEQQRMLKASSKERNVWVWLNAAQTGGNVTSHVCFLADKRAAAYVSLTCLLSVDALIAPSKSLKTKTSTSFRPANKDDALWCGFVIHADCELQHSKRIC